MDEAHDHDHHDHDHHHGNEQDRGWRAMLRYLRHAPSMWRSEVNEAVIARLAPTAGETVVDIGAGVGAGTVVAARLGADVVSLEPTPYMRRILGWRRRASRARDRIRIVDGAAEATGLDPGSVAGAWAVNTMHHWTDVDAAAQELARILAPGGRLVLADEDFEDPDHPEYERFADRHGGDGHDHGPAHDGDDGHDDDSHRHGFHMVDADGIAGQLRAAGLEIAAAGKEQLAGRPVIVVEAAKPS